MHIDCSFSSDKVLKQAPSREPCTCRVAMKAQHLCQLRVFMYNDSAQLLMEMKFPWYAGRLYHSA